jgi:predicted outer membrane protein
MKDLEDARDVLATEGSDTLDMLYIENWCAIHKTTERLTATLARIPEM